MLQESELFAVSRRTGERREFNMNTRTENQPKKKEVYVKPEVKQIMLKPEEAILGACKTATVAGPAQSKCNNSGLKCSNIGS
jgi:hypothetical protein